MLKKLLALSLLCLPIMGFANNNEDPMVVFHTTDGDIKIELFQQQAPVTVENFLDYVKSGFYDGTIFHRVIPGFVIQGGGFTADFKQKATRAPIKNESDNGLDNKRGTLSMARTSDPNSATSQFFINLSDNTPLDYHGGQWGYAVFGKVVEGMDVVDQIAQVPTGTHGVHRDVPKQTIEIKDAAVIDQ